MELIELNKLNYESKNLESKKEILTDNSLIFLNEEYESYISKFATNKLKSCISTLIYEADVFVCYLPSGIINNKTFVTSSDYFVGSLLNFLNKEEDLNNYGKRTILYHVAYLDNTFSKFVFRGAAVNDTRIKDLNEEQFFK